MSARYKLPLQSVVFHELGPSTERLCCNGSRWVIVFNHRFDEVPGLRSLGNVFIIEARSKVSL